MKFEVGCVLIRELKKVCDALQDISILGVNGVKRGARYGQEKFTNILLQKQRKSLMADLGRAVYEFSIDNEHTLSFEDFLGSPEVQDILREIREIELQMDAATHGTS